MAETNMSPSSAWIEGHKSISATGRGPQGPEPAGAPRPPGCVFSGAVLTGATRAEALRDNAAAIAALARFGSQSQEFAAAYQNAPATALAALTQLARVSAGFAPADSAPAPAQFNDFAQKLASLPLLLLTSAARLTGFTNPWSTPEEAVSHIASVLPVALPDVLRHELSGLLTGQMELAAATGTAPARDFAIYLFQIEAAAGALDFSLSGSTWAAGAAWDRPAPRNKQLTGTVTLKSGVNVVYHWSQDNWSQDAGSIAPKTTALPTFDEWIDGFSTPGASG